MDAPPDEVWAYRLDFTNLPHYNPDVHNLVRVTEGGADGVGARYRFDLDAPGGPHPIDLRVTASVPGRVVAIEMDGALPARETMTVVPDTDGEGGSTVAIALTLVLPDSVPASADESLIDSGARQVDDELTAMAAILAGRDPR
jgi:uncharacterized protein YndB with AHSA1/START domain